MYSQSSSHREEASDAAQSMCIGLPCCSQRSSREPETATRGIPYRLSNTTSQGECEGTMPSTTVTPIQSPDQLKNVLRQAKEPNSRLVVLEFTALWSEPCKFMRPVLEQIASVFDGKADFYTLEVEQFKTFARNTGVEALPTFLVVRKTILERIIGVSKDELQRGIEKHLSSAAITDLVLH